MRSALISVIFASVAISAPASDAEPLKQVHAPKNQAASPAELEGLLHARPDQVKARLGDPEIIHVEGAGALWTYRSAHCALYLFFKAEHGLSVSGASAGATQRGGAALDVDACVAELSQSRPIANAP